MRTTVEIPDDLYRRAKIQAAERGVRLRDLVEEGLRRVLASPPSAAPSRRVDFPLLRSAHPGALSPGDVSSGEDRAVLEEDLQIAGPV